VQLMVLFYSSNRRYNRCASEGRYVWDLTTTDSSGLITRRIEGRATVTPSVSR